VSIEGRIAVDVNFTDSATGAASSVKKIQLVDATPYTSGKVVVLSGTCGTTAVTLWGGPLSPMDYLDASGSAVTVSDVLRVSFAATPAAVIRGESSWADAGIASSGGNLAVASRPPQSAPSFGGSINIRTLSGTAAYTAVFYGT
jgi:hypothetical protein